MLSVAVLGAMDSYASKRPLIVMCDSSRYVQKESLETDFCL